MDIECSFIVIFLASLVHACFQLSISVLTMLSGRSLGSKLSPRKIDTLSIFFVIGSMIMTFLLLSSFLLIICYVDESLITALDWSIICGLTIGVGLAIWLFYYRKNGTSIWIPRSFAEFLNTKIKTAKNPMDTLTLGIMSVLGEIIFIIAPVSSCCLAILSLPSYFQPVGIIIYVLASSSSLLILWLLISHGKSISSIQKWREDNKKFLQFVSGGVLIALSLFIFVNGVINI